MDGEDDFVACVAGNGIGSGQTVKRGRELRERRSKWRVTRIIISSESESQPHFLDRLRRTNRPI